MYAQQQNAIKELHSSTKEGAQCFEWLFDQYWIIDGNSTAKRRSAVWESQNEHFHVYAVVMEISREYLIQIASSIR